MAKENLPNTTFGKESVPGSTSSKESLPRTTFNKEAISGKSWIKEAINVIGSIYDMTLGGVLYGDDSSLYERIKREFIKRLDSFGKEIVASVSFDGFITDTGYDGAYTTAISSDEYNGAHTNIVWSKDAIPTAPSARESTPSTTFTKEVIPRFTSDGKE